MCCCNLCFYLILWRGYFLLSKRYTRSSHVSHFCDEYYHYEVIHVNSMWHPAQMGDIGVHTTWQMKSKRRKEMSNFKSCVRKLIVLKWSYVERITSCLTDSLTHALKIWGSGPHVGWSKLIVEIGHKHKIWCRLLYTNIHNFPLLLYVPKINDVIS